ncbi:MAG: GntR family transcriptional regulator [Proteobacteria bacterium]|nr:MAG: GntR family transcriptional regulator [Pseudomonadota bacterium]
MQKSSLAPISRQSLVETIVNRLETAMMDGSLAPGEKLSEMALARTLGVSRGPLREAIRQLEGRKLIERIPNVGARVAAFSREALYELLIIREALEGIACRIAAKEMTDEDLARLEELLLADGCKEGVRKGTDYFLGSNDRDIHSHIVRCCRNERLVAMLCDDLYDLLRVYRGKISAISGRATAAYEEHAKIVDALKARDPDSAEAAMREHIRNSRRHAMDHFDTKLAPLAPSGRKADAQ